MRPTILVLPGYGDSGPGHWQTLWERRFGYARVRQDDWERPLLPDWIARLDDAVAAASGPVAFVAHSLGCALVSHWAARAGTDRVAGALLVAPPDVDEIRHFMPEVESFAPMPAARLPFPSIVVASTDDPYADAAVARRFADAWGARFVDVGAKGHVNAESNLGDWLDGHRLLEELLEGRAAQWTVR